MAETSLLLGHLKQVLKSRGVRYRELAVALGLSEASVKRIFSRGTLSLRRLERICAFLGIHVYDLARAAGGAREPKVTAFDERHESALAADPKLFGYFYLLVDGLRPGQIVARYRISEGEGRRFLLRLDKLGLIELHPGDRVRVLASRDVIWSADGPLFRAYGRRIQREFLDSDFRRANQAMHIAAARLSPAALGVFRRKVERLLRELTELSDLEEERKEGDVLWLLLAYRPWTFSGIEVLRRK